jgi:hypothetical protein
MGRAPHSIPRCTCARCARARRAIARLGLGAMPLPRPQPVLAAPRRSRACALIAPKTPWQRRTSLYLPGLVNVTSLGHGLPCTAELPGTASGRRNLSWWCACRQREQGRSRRGHAYMPPFAFSAPESNIGVICLSKCSYNVEPGRPAAETTVFTDPRFRAPSLAAGVRHSKLGGFLQQSSAGKAPQASRHGEAGGELPAFAEDRDRLHAQGRSCTGWVFTGGALSWQAADTAHGPRGRSVDGTRACRSRTVRCEPWPRPTEASPATDASRSPHAPRHPAPSLPAG